MASSNFDELTRALASSTSRRQTIKAIFASTLGGVLAFGGLGTALAAGCVIRGPPANTIVIAARMTASKVNVTVSHRGPPAAPIKSAVRATARHLPWLPIGSAPSVVAMETTAVQGLVVDLFTFYQASMVVGGCSSIHLSRRERKSWLLFYCLHDFCSQSSS